MLFTFNVIIDMTILLFVFGLFPLFFILLFPLSYLCLGYLKKHFLVFHFKLSSTVLTLSLHIIFFSFGRDNSL